MPPDPPREQGPPGLATPTQINATPTQINATPTSKAVENPEPWFHSISLKNYLILYASEKNQYTCKASCLKQGSEMNNFCLKNGQVLKPLAAHFSPNFPGVLPRVFIKASLRSRRLEVVGERENGHTRGRHARGEGAPAQKAPENRFNSHSVSADISHWSRCLRGKKLPSGAS